MPDRMPMLRFVSGCRLLAALGAGPKDGVTDAGLEVVCRPVTLKSTVEFLKNGGFLQVSGKERTVADGVFKSKIPGAKPIERLSDFHEAALHGLIQAAISKAHLPFTLRIDHLADANVLEILVFLQGTPDLNLDGKLDALRRLPRMSLEEIKTLRGGFLRDWLQLAGQCLSNPAHGAETIARVQNEWQLLVKHLERVLLISLPADGVSPPHRIERIPLAPTPSRIEEALKEVVIAQEDAKKKIATLIHYQMIQQAKEQQGDAADFRQLPPLLLVGPTGCGKTLLVSEACALAGLPFLAVDCAGMVSEGIVGFSVGDIGKRLLHGNKPLEAVRHAVVFFDEFDKLLATHYGEDVMAQILLLLEGGSIHLETHSKDSWTPPAPALPTKDMLFIIGGAFQKLYEQSKRKIGFSSKAGTEAGGLTVEDLRLAGVPAELLGRVGSVSIMRELNAADLEKILRSHRSPLKVINEMLEVHQSKVVLPDSAYKKIARAAHDMRLGARGLRQIIHALAEPYLFSVPDNPGQQITPTEDEVNRALQKVGPA